MKNTVEEASFSDGVEMLEIIESKSAKGNIELIYTRRPNAYESYLKESKKSKIALTKDENGKIVFQAACVARDYYINGKKTSVGYVGGVRKRGDYKGLINWKAVADFVKSCGCQLYYCSFLSANESSIKLFSKTRSSIPKLTHVCEYTTYVINPKVFKKPVNLQYNFRNINENDLKKVYAFLKQEGMKYTFSLVVDNLEEQFFGLSLSDCYILENGGSILAFGALWNQTNFKQYVVAKYSDSMKLMCKFSKIAELLGYIQMPKENEILNFPVLSLFYAKNNNQQYYKCFLNEIAVEIKKHYKMFVVGMNTGHPNNEVYKQLKTVNFNSKIYFTKFDNEFMLDENKPFHIECGLL